MKLTVTQNPGTQFDQGATLVQYTAADSSGNIAVCKFNVTVSGSTPNVLTIDKFITPDGDGINDAWQIKNIEKYSKNKVMVFDRWGSVIFSASGYDNQIQVWNGSDSKGKQLPAGTYFYSIDLGDGSAVQKGFIELIK